MGYGGMPRKKKDEFDWDNADALADLEKEPEGTGTISGTTPEKKGKDKKGKKKGGKGDDSDEDAPPPQPKRFDSTEDFSKAQAAAAPEQVNGDAAKGKGKSKGKKGKGKDSDSEDEPAAAAAPVPAPAGKGAKGKKGKGKESEDEEEESSAQASKPAAKGKKSKKGKKGQDSSEDEDEPSAPAEDTQPSKAAASKAKKNKKGKKADSSDDDEDEASKKGAGGKGKVSFAALADEDEDDDARKDSKKGSKASGKNKAAASFAALAGDDDDDEDNDDDEEEEVPSKPTSSKAGGKSAAFAALAAEDDEEEEEEEEEEDTAPKAKAGKNKGKKSKENDDDGDGFAQASKAAKPAKAKAPVKAPAASFAALMGEGSGDEKSNEDEEPEAVAEKPTKPSKSDKSAKEKKEKEKPEPKADKGKKAAAPEPVAEEKLPPLTLEEAKVLKDILKKCVFQGVVVGLVKSLEKHPKANNLFLATVTDGGFTEAQVVTNNKGVEVGMKVAFAPVGSEVFDEELGTGTTTVKAVKVRNVNSAGMLCSGKLLGLNEDGDNVLTLPSTCPLGIDVGEAFIRLVKPEMMEEAKSKAAEARRQAEEALAAKKAAKDAKDAKKAAEAPKGEGEGADDQGDPSKKKKGKEVKVNAKVAALQEMQRKLKEEQDRLAKIAEEQRKAEEEAERQWKEEEERKKKDKERKKELKKQREEELRKQGLLLSKKQKEQKAKDEAYRKQLEAQGIVPPRPAKDSKEGESSSSEEETSENKTGEKAGGAQRLSKNDIKKQEAERKARMRAMQEERERRKAEEEKAREEAERIERELAAIANNWEDEAGADGADNAAAPAAEEEEESSDIGSEYDSDGGKLSKTQRRARKSRKAAEARRMRKMEKNLNAKSKDNLRCPVICVLGHVDTGKTKILDKLRRTNVQDGEAGGITQQIGASYFPIENIIEKTLPVMKLHKATYNVPGLLTIDTPGHESFTNLRTRGSSLCDLAVLVVDIMHGLEPQTIESIGLLKKRKAPFVIALNKIDRLFGWKSKPDQPVQQTLEEQEQNVKDEFENRYNFVVTQLAEQGLNACTFYNNKDVRTYINMVPTSAISGDGMMDLLFLLTTLPSKMLVDQIMYHENLESTVLEVKAIEGLGTTMDVILVNGRLKEKDTIVVCGLDGPIVTQIRSLLTPQPMKEMRVKTPYLHHKEVKGAQGVKICANGIERALAGSNLLVAGEDDDIEELKEDVMKDIGGILKKVRKNEDGVYVQSSTLGSLEALLEYLEVYQPPRFRIRLLFSALSLCDVLRLRKCL